MWMCDLSGCCVVIVFFYGTSTPDIHTYWPTLSLHDALPVCRPPGAELLVDLALIGPVLLGAQVVVARILIAVVEEGAREKVIEGELQHPPPQLARYVEIGRGRPGERNRHLGPEKAAPQAVRSEERRLENECVSTCRSRWAT